MADNLLEKWRLDYEKRNWLPSDPVSLAHMALDLDAKAAAGPWGACHAGECSCKQVWHPDFPVAVVTSGEWGDEYPAIRYIEGTGMSDTQVEAYMRKLVYGEVGDKLATANAQFIALARTALPVLARAVLAMSHYGVDVDGENSGR